MSDRLGEFTDRTAGAAYRRSAPVGVLRVVDAGAAGDARRARECGSDLRTARRRRNAGWLAAPAPPPTFDAASTWDAIAQRSDVMSGRWSGLARKETKPAPGRVARRREADDTARARHRRREAGRRAGREEHERCRPMRKRGLRNASSRARFRRRDRADRPDPRRESSSGVRRLRVLDAHVAIGQGDYEHAYCDAAGRVTRHSRLDAAARSARSGDGSDVALCGSGGGLSRTAHAGLDQHALVGRIRGHAGKARASTAN